MPQISFVFVIFISQFIATEYAHNSFLLNLMVWLIFHVMVFYQFVQNKKREKALSVLSSAFR